jgi:hypothetical protein
VIRFQSHLCVLSTVVQDLQFLSELKNFTTHRCRNGGGGRGPYFLATVCS